MLDQIPLLTNPGQNKLQPDQVTQSKVNKPAAGMKQSMEDAAAKEQHVELVAVYALEASSEPLMWCKLRPKHACAIKLTHKVCWRHPAAISSLHEVQQKHHLICWAADQFVKLCLLPNWQLCAQSLFMWFQSVLSCSKCDTGHPCKAAATC